MRHSILNKFLKIFLFVVCLELFLLIGAPLTRLYYSLEEKMFRQKQDVYRILCLGESITFTGGDNSYPKQLERLLNARAGTVKFEVINKGIPGKTSNEIIKVLDDVLNAYRPDLVISMVGIHDVVFSVVVKDNWISWLKLNVLSKFKVYLLSRDLKVKFMAYVQSKGKTESETAPAIELGPPKEPVRTLGTPEERTDGMYRLQALLHPHPLSLRNYNEMVEIMRRRNIQIFVMQYPLVSIEPLKSGINDHRMVKFISNEENFKEARKRYSHEELFFDYLGGIFGHLTSAGGQIIVQNLAERIWNFCPSDPKCRAILEKNFRENQD